MKKFFMIFAMVMLATFAVGCTKNTANNAGTNANNNAPAQANTNAGSQQQATNNGQVEVSGETLKLAQCMNDKGVRMYGTEWCGHCKNQKELFGESFSYIDYTDCDADRQACVDAGVRGFPTWIDAQGNAYPGTQQLTTLAQISGCEFAG